MTTLFLISLIVGGGLLAVSFLGGDADLDAGLDADLDLGSDVDSFRILSLRTFSYFLFGFGAAGSAMVFLAGAGPALALLVATGTGGILSVTAEALFNYLRRTESGATVGESSYIGLAARVTVPLRSGQAGKVLVTRGDRTYEFVARSYDPDAPDVDDWTEVMIVEMKAGEALVAPAGPGGLPRE